MAPTTMGPVSVTSPQVPGRVERSSAASVTPRASTSITVTAVAGSTRYNSAATVPDNAHEDDPRVPTMASTATPVPRASQVRARLVTMDHAMVSAAAAGSG